MSEPTTIIGAPVSPYVRKVMAVCDIKRVVYCMDPIIPFRGNDEFNCLSPLRRVPVLIDNQVTLPDSTAIAEYLDERHRTSGVFPVAWVARTKAVPALARLNQLAERSLTTRRTERPAL